MFKFAEIAISKVCTARSPQISTDHKFSYRKRERSYVIFGYMEQTSTNMQYTSISNSKSHCSFGFVGDHGSGKSITIGKSL